MSHFLTTPRHRARRPTSHSMNINELILATLLDFYTTYQTWKNRRRQRQHLRDLAHCSERLKDIGVTYDQAVHEGQKTFWQD